MDRSALDRPKLHSERKILQQATEALKNPQGHPMPEIPVLRQAVRILQKAEKDRQARKQLRRLRGAIAEYLKKTQGQQNLNAEFHRELEEMEREIKAPEGLEHVEDFADTAVERGKKLVDDATEMTRPVAEKVKQAAVDIGGRSKQELLAMGKDFEKGGFKDVALKHPVKTIAGGLGLVWLSSKILNVASPRLRKVLKWTGIAYLAWLIYKYFNKGFGVGGGSAATPGSAAVVGKEKERPVRTIDAPVIPKPDVPPEPEWVKRRRVDPRLVEKPQMRLDEWEKRREVSIYVLGGHEVDLPEKFFEDAEGGPKLSVHEVVQLLQSKQRGKDGVSRVIDVTFEVYENSIARDHKIMRAMEEAIRKEPRMVYRVHLPIGNLPKKAKE
ncbi:hypothetical protein HY213_04250 [Candidatus Peregrinibacteria bacterium]|nr:hypothetical protein [Candidatus Peregrinibacteria bacterium]